VDPQHPTAFPSWLSFDLRFFKMVVPPGGTASRFGAPVTGGADAPAFIASVIQNLTAGNGAVGGDSFDPGLSQDEGASAVEFQQRDNAGNSVFNFAVARVRLLAKSSAVAKKVRVFFRLFQAQNTVSNFTETTTYRYWTDGTAFGTKVPLAGVQANASGNLEYVTIPCFAAKRITLVDPTKSMADQTDDPNAYDLPTDPGHEKDYFFGCWIDNNQTDGILPTTLPAGSLPPPGQRSTTLDGPWPSGTPLGSMKDAMTAFPHQCLIAELRYDDTPIPLGATTATSDKLAQRNIAWIDGPNPAAPASRRMSHPVQVRPTPAVAGAPDELLFLWQRIPEGTTAQLFLPDVDANIIAALAQRESGSQYLEVIDPHTIRFGAGGATFIPLPDGLGAAAGLLAVDLPPGIKKGDSYAVDVRQVTTASGFLSPPPPPQPRAGARGRARGRQPDPAMAVRVIGDTLRWRQVEGAFRFHIAISTKEQLLLTEERLLAVLRWMATQTPTTRRWYPVLHRYIDDVAGRVEGFGGNPGSIEPSPTGQVPRSPSEKDDEDDEDDEQGDEEIVGKVFAVLFDHFGDFDGFVIETEDGRRHRFSSREHRMRVVVEEALEDRLRVAVEVRRRRREVPRRIALLR
jgi:hypothetical protein